MNANRRNFLKVTLGGLGMATAGKVAAQEIRQAPPSPAREGGAVPVESPDIQKLPWRVEVEVEDDVKVFRLRAEPVRTEFAPGRVVDGWGFNGSIPGPTIEVNQGDRVRFIVENHLPELFSVHWHGLEVPIEMDGVSGLTQDPIPPGGRFVYEFTLHQHGTFFYHSHMPMQEMMGMVGLFIIHPTEPYAPRVDRDFGLIFQEWAILPNNTIPNTLSMEFNWLTINGKAGPAATPMLVKLGERVRIRLVNLSMDDHPIHLHGNTFHTVGTEGGRIPQVAWQPGNTVLLGVAQARDVEFDAQYPGDWVLHCHLPHHMMNQMVSMVGPMTHLGQGMHTGLGMQEGMGMIRQGQALAESLGPSFGRTIGVGAVLERPVTNLPLGSRQVGLQPGQPTVAPNALQVPGFPQDMFMVMDDEVAKPETYGLRPTWTGGLMGMMTLVRVLEPEVYDRIQALKAEQAERRAV